MALSREILSKNIRRRRSWKKRIQKQRRILEEMECRAAEMREELKSIKVSCDRDVAELREREASVERMSQERRIQALGAVRSEACRVIMAALLYAHNVGDFAAVDHLRRVLRSVSS